MTSRPYLVYPPTAAGLADHAPPTPHPPPPPATSPTAAAASGDTAIAPVVTYADPDPPPASATGAPPRGALRHGSGGLLREYLWSAGALFLALAFAALLIVLATHHSAHPIAGAPAGSGAAAPARTVPLRVHHAHRLGPIHLPNPLGNAVRTVPLETIWIIDQTMPRADLTAFSQEAPVDVTYLADHALTGDQLGFAFRPRTLEHVRTHQTDLAAAVARPAGILVAEPGQPIHLPSVIPGHDRAIVVITANPSPWLRDMPAGPTPPAPIAGSRPGQTRTYILDLVPGSGRQSDPLTPSSTQPQHLTADPGIRGGIARAVARAFVDAIGATWPA